MPPVRRKRGAGHGALLGAGVKTDLAKAALKVAGPLVAKLLLNKFRAHVQKRSRRKRKGGHCVRRRKGRGLKSAGGAPRPAGAGIRRKRYGEGTLRRAGEGIVTCPNRGVGSGVSILQSQGGFGRGRKKRKRGLGLVRAGERRGGRKLTVKQKKTLQAIL